MEIEVPKIYWGVLYTNILASLLTLVLLAGFLAPQVNASLRTSRALSSIGNAGKVVLSKVQDIPPLYIAGSCFLCGVVGLLWIWWENRQNYIWLTDRAFL